MRMKRWIVVAVSLIVGVVATGVIIYGPAPVGFGTNAHDFAYSNVLLLFISIACIVGIWLDYFLGAQILKS